MSKITVYEKPTCTTCRQVSGILKEKGIDFDAVNYYIDPIPKDKIKDLLSKMKIPASDLARKKESIYKELGLASKDLSEEEWVDLYAKHPDLIQRPIVEKGSKAILARPSEKIKEIL